MPDLQRGADLVTTIERLTAPVNPDVIRALAHLLVDTVHAGAAVSFVAPLTVAQAEAWWNAALADDLTRRIVLVARDRLGIAGTVQLQPAWAPNQPHRAEISKLMVHRRARRAGLGARLMDTIERAALEAGFTLLTLDARAGDAADRLYRRLGWTAVGTIPRYAVDPDGKGWHDAVIFYKELGGHAVPPGQEQR